MESDSPCEIKRYAKIVLSLPPCFHLVFEDEQHRARVDARKDKAKAGSRGRPSIIAARQDLNNWKDVMLQAMSAPFEFVVMNLRKTSASIGEIWAGFLSQIDISGSRNLGMSTDVSCSSEVRWPAVVAPPPFRQA